MRNGTLLMLAALAGAGCSTQQPAPKPVTANDPPPADDTSSYKMVDPTKSQDSDGLQVSGLAGTLTERQVESGVRPKQRRLRQCFSARARKMPFIGGEVRFTFKVATDGSVSALRVAKSTLGDFEIEDCMRTALLGATFDKPSGGKTAEVSYSMVFQARHGLTVSELDLGAALAAVPRQARATAKRVPRGLTTTLYLKRGGRLLTAGFSADEPVERNVGDALLAALKAAKLPRTSDAYIKASYSWR